MERIVTAREILGNYRAHLGASPMLAEQLETLKDLTREEAVELLYLMLTSVREEMQRLTLPVASATIPPMLN